MLKKTCLALGLSVALFGSIMIPAIPARADEEIQAVASVRLDTIETSENLQVSLQDVYELKADDYNTVSFTIEIQNNRSIDVQFIDYWIKVMSTAGVEYTVNLLPQEKDKNTIPAQTSQTFSFYAKVGKDISVKDLEFRFVKWDFDSSQFEKLLGVMKVPSDYVMEAPEGSSKAVQIANAPVAVNIKRCSLSRNDKYVFPYVTVEMKNTGSTSVKLPDIQYFMMSETGILYPLQASGLVKDTALNPLVTTEGTMTATIPLTVSQSGWKLIIAQNIQVDNKTITLPMGMYHIPSADVNEVSVGNEYEFSTESGTYVAKLNSIRRLPWEDQDILSADLTVSNPSEESLPLPDFGGYFKLDDNVKLDAKAMILDDVIGLPKGKSVNIQLSAKLPYTYTFSTVKLFLQELVKSDVPSGEAQTTATTKVNDLLQFTHRAELMSIPVAGLGETYPYSSVGRNYELAVRKVITFDNKVEDLFEAQLLVKNKEKRFTNISRMVAYFVTSDGVMFPTNISEIKSKVKPEGSALYQITTTLPRGYKTSDMRLLVGEAVKDGKLAMDKESDGYIKPVYLTLPPEMKEPAHELKNLDIFPYQLSLSRIGTYFEDFLNNKLALELDYELSKDSMIVSNTENHKLVLEIEDPSSDVKAEKVYTLDKDIKAGKDHLKESLTVTDLKLRLEDIQHYNFNVYYELDSGHRQLVATKQLTWFVYND